MIDTPHFQLPFRFDGDSVPEVEEDSYDDVLQCVFGVISYHTGDLIFNPGLGIPAQEFRTGGANLSEISAAINRYEPRANSIIEDEETLLSIIDLVNVKVSDIP